MIYETAMRELVAEVAKARGTKVLRCKTRPIRLEAKLGDGTTFQEEADHEGVMIDVSSPEGNHATLYLCQSQSLRGWMRELSEAGIIARAHGFLSGESLPESRKGGAS